ncbi:MAG TPA: hypothetical protein VH879_02255 [Gemmatimonadales bacterium]|jgi:hypothetical protein
MPKLPRLSPAPLVLTLILSASAISAQQTPESTTLGGYGEVHYTNRSGPGTPGEVNVKRFVIFLAHSFNDRLAVRSELELEDTKIEGGAGGGEVALEQLFLDYRLSDAVSLRTGLVLVPIGIINETHEPPTFNGVARPNFDQEVLPTTWREIGVGAAGSVPGGHGLGYRLFLVSGLRAEGFSGTTGIRGGRQEGKEAGFANPSLTGRLEWTRPGLRLGSAFWYGGSAAQDSVLGLGAFAAPVLVLAADVRYDIGAFAFRGVAARISVADAEAINARFATDVGRRIEGGYLEGAVNLLRLLVPSTGQRLLAFVRHERYDLHAAVPTGTAANDSYARRVTTVGLSYKPLWNVVFKADYQLNRNRAGLGQDEALALGIGYQF